MDLFETIEKRYSYRGEFTDAPVPDADLRRMLQAALQAPSGLNGQTSGFVAVKDPGLRRALAEIFPHRGIATAPVVIVALSCRKEMYAGVAFEDQDYAAGVENLLLAVTALGYATVWTDGQTMDDHRPEKIAKLLNVPARYRVRALLPVGVPKEPGHQKEKQPFEQRVQIDAFPANP